MSFILTCWFAMSFGRAGIIYIYIYFYIYIYTSRAGQAGAEVSKGNVRQATNQCDAQTHFWGSQYYTVLLHDTKYYTAVQSTTAYLRILLSTTK